MMPHKDALTHKGWDGWVRVTAAARSATVDSWLPYRITGGIYNAHKHTNVIEGLDTYK
jgi:hypothetical protein